MSKVEDAAARLRALIQSDDVRKLRGANEAATRLLIIDQVLEILGWPKADFNPEYHTTTGYTDYLLAIEGRHRLIVEAKRLGLISPLPRTIQNPEYMNSFLWGSCGPEMQDLLDQCRRYCIDCGVPYALATTGEVWIVLVGFRSGVEWRNLRSVVFHSLEDVATRFSDFYGLVSRDAVKENSLEDRLGNLVVVRPTTAIRPRDQIEYAVEVPEVPDRRLIEAYFDSFMGDITDREDMLDHCYVKTRELTEFTRDLQKLLEYDPVLDELDVAVDSADEQRLDQEIAFQHEAGTPKTILLVGNIGAGKSTFIHRFHRAYATPRKYICVIADLIDQAATESQHDRAEEQHICDLVLNQLAHVFQGMADPYDPSVLRGCFEVELNRFGIQHRSLSRQNHDEFDLQEEKHLAHLVDDKYKHLVGFIKYTRKKFRRIWIAFDNVDRGSESFQRFIYAFAHRLSRDARCPTLITLREDTFLEAKHGGFLDVRRSDTILRISAPEFKQVVSRRRKYVDRLIQQSALPKSLGHHAQLVASLNSHIKHLVLDSHDGVRLLVVAFSMNNIREAFGMLRDYYTSYHSTFHDYFAYAKDRDFDGSSSPESGPEELNRFLQGLMLGNGWSYKESASPVFNLFYAEELEQGSHFLTLHFLAYLSREAKSAPTSAIKYNKAANDLTYLGHQRRHIETCVRRLLLAGLLLSPNLPSGALREQKIQLPDPLPGELKLVLSPKGYYHLNMLASHPYYQTRVGEDTVWYDEELSSLYIGCIKEALDAQGAYQSRDPLDITQARDIFLQYLRKSLQEEAQSGSARYLSKEWTRLVGDLVERKVFGTPVTRTVVVSDSDAVPDPARVAAGQRAHAPSKLRDVRQHQSNLPSAIQLSLFQDVLHEEKSFDYESAVRHSVNSLGTLPPSISHASRNLVRILWALEVASSSSLGPIRATDITTLLSVFGGEEVTLPNMAKFIRLQKRNGGYTHLWKEEPQGYYRINSAGRALLHSLLFGSDETMSMD